MRRKLCIRLITNLAFTGFVAFSAPSVGAQGDDTASAQQGTPDTAAVRGIAASDVAQRAESVNERLRQTRGRVEVDPAVAELSGSYPAVVAAIDTLMQEPANVDPEGQSRRRLSNLRQRWLSYEAQLDDWQAVVGTRAAELESELASIDSIQRIWEHTDSVAAALGYPEATRAQIGSTLNAIEEVLGELRSRLDAVLTMQNQISAEKIRVTRVLDRVELAGERARSRLLLPDQAPIWNVRPADGGAMVAQIRASWSEEAETLGRFLRRNRDDLVVHAVIFIGLLALMVLLRRREIAADKDRMLESTAHVLGRPISAALLVALILTGFVYIDEPSSIFEAARLIALVPILRLVPGLVPGQLRRTVYALAVLYLLELMHQIVPEGSVLQRSLLLLVTLLALGGTIFLVRLSRRMTEEERAWRWVFVATRLAAGVLTVSVIGNLLGFVALAQMLTVATLNTAYLAAAIYAAVRIIEGLVRVSMRTPALQSVNAVRRNPSLLTRRGLAIVHVTGVVIWFGAVLWIFGLLGPVIDAAGLVLGKSFTVGSVSISLGGILTFFITIWLAFLSSRLVRFILNEDVLPRVDLPRGVPGAISKLSHYVIIGFGIFIAVAAAGLELDKLTIIIGALGVGIGFGLQNVVNNFISGLILIFERPVQEGDTVQVGSLMGIVRRIGIRSSTVRTYDGSEVIVPNGNLTSNEVINWTLSDRQRRLEVPVGVAYGTDPHRVIEILHKVAKENSQVLEHPEPLCEFNGFGDSSLDFTLRFWIPTFENWREVSSEVTLGVHDALSEAGIEIPFPQRDLHLKSSDIAVKPDLS